MVMLVTFTILGFPLGEVSLVRYAYSQSNQTNSTSNAAVAGVDLKDIHPSSTPPLKVGSKFEIFATVVNNLPGTIMFTAGTCQSPLSAYFNAFDVVVKHSQGCTATSPPFKLGPGKEVTVAGPSSDTIYQAISAGKTRATAIFHYQTENGQAADISKPFAFIIG
ncbi:MAG TPA: hypothetical protein VI278_15385 [Nitrososphaeraceae archaeon]